MTQGEFRLLPPGWFNLPGSTASLMSSLLEAAAALYTLEPWLILDGEVPIEVRYPPDVAPRLVVVMGSGGDLQGLCAYDSLADLRHVLEAGDPLDAAGKSSWLALTYDTRDYILPDDLEAIERFGWHLAGAALYPAVARIGPPGPELRSPTLEDLVWLEGVLWGLVEWLRHAPQGPALDKFLQRGVELRLETDSGLGKIAFRPLSGRV